MPKHLLIAFTGVAALGVCASTIPVKERAQVSTTRVIANGMASASITVEALSILGTRTWARPDALLNLARGQDLVRLGPAQVEPGVWRRDLIAGTHAGTVEWQLTSSRAGTLADSLELIPDRGDTDEDGFPNALELVAHEDRTAFRRWFADIAFAQHLEKDVGWATVHRDCAGFVRYAYKEALKPHDAIWWDGRRSFRPSSSRDVSRFHYPRLPIVGERIFRTGNPEESFGVSASARILRDENTTFVGHGVSVAQHGDLLFFEKRGDSGHIFHTMIFLRELPNRGTMDSSDGPHVVYHTGPEGVGVSTPDDTGEVRLVAWNELLEHPDSGWHPRRDNPDFSGFYRWKILE